MREIKFRAWSKLLNKMLSHEDLNKTLKDLTKIQGIEGIFLPLNSDVEVMQYTGLKDNNGKEIYEGDIVQCNGNKDDLHEIKFGEFEVYDHDSEEAIDIAEGWYFKILDNDVFSNVEPFCYPTPLNKYWVDKIDVKVIGNIYENPELLA